MTRRHRYGQSGSDGTIWVVLSMLIVVALVWWASSLWLDNEGVPPVPTTTGGTVYTSTLLPVPLTDSATAASVAVRGLAMQVTQPPAPPPTTTEPALHGEVVASGNCTEMQLYRIGAGLPSIFDQLAKRESNCTNTPISRTGCCVGYWQLHHVIFRDWRMIFRLADCGANWLNVRGDDTGSKTRQACAAKALYDVMGLGPWAT